MGIKEDIQHRAREKVIRDRCVVRIALGSEILLFKYEKEGSRGPNQQQYGVFSRGPKKRKSSNGEETYAPGRKGDPQRYVVGKIGVQHFLEY